MSRIVIYSTEVKSSEVISAGHFHSGASPSFSSVQLTNRRPLPLSSAQPHRSSGRFQRPSAGPRPNGAAEDHGAGRLPAGTDTRSRTQTAFEESLLLMMINVDLRFSIFMCQVHIVKSESSIPLQ